jgi:hypothetical protein
VGVVKFPKRLAVVVVLVVVVVGAVKLLSSDNGPAFVGDGGPTPSDDSFVQRARGGVVRVGVSTPPELSDIGDGGTALRSLVHPSLFIAQPDRSWRAGVAVPGSDRYAKNGLSAKFRLRPTATWSDGSRISIDDLRRTADKRFVASLEGPETNGDITVFFTQRFPGWHMLWSGEHAITPPNDTLFGGPYVVQTVTSGLETDLVRNNDWYAAKSAAFLDEIDLVLVPDPATARELLAAGRIDVLAPTEDTVRTDQLKAIQDVSVERAEEGGMWAALRTSATHVHDQARPTLLSSFPRNEFVSALLHGEATSIDGLGGDSDDTWSSLPAGSTLQGTNLQISSLSGYPLSTLLDRSLERSATKAGATVTTRDGDLEQLQDWLASNDFDVMLQREQDGPYVCWSCHFADVDEALAAQADAGDVDAMQRLENELRDRSLLLPLYRPVTVVGYNHRAVSGVEANGYDSAVTWNAATWWRTAK